MKIIKELPLSACDMTAHRFDRFSLAKSLKSHGKSEASIGHNVVVTKNGIITGVSQANGFFRRDVTSLTFRHRAVGAIAAVFIDPDGSYTGLNGTDLNIEFDDADRAYVDEVVRKWVSENTEHLEKTQRWFAEHPWTNITTGMTVDAAINVIRKAGW